MQLNEQLAAEFFRARSFDEFLNQARELVRLQPFESGAHLVLARALEWQRRFDEALASCDEAKRLRSSETEQSYRASIEAVRGHILAAQKIAERLRAFWLTNPFQSALLAALFAQLREADPAVDVLNQGFVRDDSTVLTAPTNPYFDAIRNTDGFLNFLHKLDWQGVR
jgi:DNA-binding SARP family transcriptional activator